MLIGTTAMLTGVAIMLKNLAIMQFFKQACSQGGSDEPPL